MTTDDHMLNIDEQSLKTWEGEADEALVLIQENLHDLAEAADGVDWAQRSLAQVNEVATDLHSRLSDAYLLMGAMLHVIELIGNQRDAAIREKATAAEEAFMDGLEAASLSFPLDWARALVERFGVDFEHAYHVAQAMADYGPDVDDYTLENLPAGFEEGFRRLIDLFKDHPEG